MFYNYYDQEKASLSPKANDSVYANFTTNHICFWPFWDKLIHNVMVTQ